MIFVTVGTHEQQFNRLVNYMDSWANIHDEDVVIQTGFSTYIPKYAKWKQIYPYEEMKKNMYEARVVITHGGPSSFLEVLQIGKVPIVVPRRKKFQEHVNDHQYMFCTQVKERLSNILLVDDINCISKYIEDYEDIVKTMVNTMNSNNRVFCKRFKQIVEEIMK